MGAEGRYVEQLGILAETTKACPELLTNINNYAWALSTLPDSRLRDGGKAVGMIRRTIIKLGERDPASLSAEDLVVLFGFYLQEHMGKATWSALDITTCFTMAGLSQPRNMIGMLSNQAISTSLPPT